MPRKLPLVLAFALVAATVTAARADDDDTPSLADTPHITVTGSATTEMAPDLVTITLGVSNHKPTAKAAADATATDARAIVDAAKAEGIEPGDIATQTLTLAQSSQSVLDEKGRYIGRKPTGFDALNMIAIRVRDLSKVGALAQGLIDKGANNFDGIAFSVEHPQPILDRLAGEAIANARRKAEIMAQAAGVKLGRVLLIDRAAAPFREPVRFAPRLREKGAAPEPATMPVESGNETLTTDVSVSWAIEQP